MRRSGFTLIEILVVIAIISLLLALILPAIQKVRASADKASCASNLKQIGIAMHHYHHDYGTLPPQGNFTVGSTFSGYSIHARLLPYIEQDNLHKQINYSACVTTKWAAVVAWRCNFRRRLAHGSAWAERRSARSHSSAVAAVVAAADCG